MTNKKRHKARKYTLYLDLVMLMIIMIIIIMIMTMAMLCVASLLLGSWCLYTESDFLYNVIILPCHDYFHSDAQIGAMMMMMVAMSIIVNMMIILVVESLVCVKFSLYLLIYSFFFYCAKYKIQQNKKMIQNKIVIENPLYLLIYSGSFLLPNLSAISLSPLRELTEISSSFWSNVSNVPGIPLSRCS